MWFNRLHPSYILSCFIGGSLSRHSMVVADSFSGKIFAIVKTDILCPGDLVRVMTKVDYITMLRVRMFPLSYIRIALAECLLIIKRSRITAKFVIFTLVFLKCRRALIGCLVCSVGANYEWGKV